MAPVSDTSSKGDRARMRSITPMEVRLPQGAASFPLQPQSFAKSPKSCCGTSHRHRAAAPFVLSSW